MPLARQSGQPAAPIYNGRRRHHASPSPPAGRASAAYGLPPRHTMPPPRSRHMHTAYLVVF
uniref:Uncharacterized protein n=1 Tax=Leersia perrieri TaxID=77586 RepID=A0A0D9WA80_9ORYZ